jgi:hypothetical protein
MDLSLTAFLIPKILAFQIRVFKGGGGRRRRNNLSMKEMENE